MFEAYKVGVTIALTNHISRGLFLIQRDLAKTDAQAAKLHATLGRMEKLALKGVVAGGLGYAMLQPLKAGYEAAKRYEQAFNQFKAINLGDAINTDADKFARGANVIGASATDLIGTVRDLHTAMADYGMAKQLAPQIAQMKWANQAIFGGHGMDFSERQLRAMEKIVEMKNGFKSGPAFMAQADMMQKVISGTGGMVKPTDYMQFLQTAGVAGRLMTDETFYYVMEPLIQEMHAGRVGTGTMSAYNNLAQGRSTVRSAKEMMKLGLLDPKMVEYDKIGQVKRIMPGALKGMDAYTSNPYQWMKDVLLPAMAAKGITGEKAVLNEMGAIYGNRTGSNLFSLMFLQQDKIDKNMKISKNAMGVDALTKMAKSSPQGAEAALGAAWENLAATFGHTVTPIVLPALLGLREILESFRQWAEKNPPVMKALTYAFGALAAGLLFSGTVWTLQAAFLGVSTVLGLGGGLIGSVGSLAVALGPLGLAGALIAAAGATAFYHKEIAAWIDSHDWGQKLGDGLMATRDWFSMTGSDLSAGRRGGPPPSGTKGGQQLQGTMRVEKGELLVDYVSNGQAKQMNRPTNSVGYFDIGSGMASPSSAFGH